MPANVQAGAPMSGHGSPEGSVPAPVGKLYTDIDNGYLYQKERSGGMDVGWVLRGVGTGGSGGGTAGGIGIPFMTTAARNAWTPSVRYAAVLLTDSDPPNQLSVWANGAWN